MKKIILICFLLGQITLTHAQTEGFIGEIRMFAGNFAPRGWALCEGQLLPISQNQALFSILGTTYGGDGRTTFALPDMRGRVVAGTGRGSGLTDRRLGQKFGSENNTLNTTQLPSHNHSSAIQAVSDVGNTNDPTGNYFANTGLFDNEYRSTGTVVNMRSGTTGNQGSSQPVNNVQPTIVINYIICLQGIFPSRS
jgi:microcystin-dependent protein